MTRTNIESAITDLNNLVTQGKMMEAFEKHYHDEVTMQENDEPPIHSKKENRKRELAFLNNLIDFRKAEVQGVGIGENISFVLWEYDYVHAEWGEKKYRQVAIQRWKDGKIIHEKFIYAN